MYSYVLLQVLGIRVCVVQSESSLLHLILTFQELSIQFTKPGRRCPMLLALAILLYLFVGSPELSVALACDMRLPHVDAASQAGSKTYITFLSFFEFATCILHLVYVELIAP